MKFALAGLSLDNYPPVVAQWERTTGGAEALRYVQKADSLSWDWLTIPEHVLMPRDMVEHMGTRFVESIVAGADQAFRTGTRGLVRAAYHRC